MDGLVIFGLGKIGQAVASLIEEEGGDPRILAYCCDRAHLPAIPEWRGRPVLAFEEIEAAFPPDRCAMLVAIGYHDLNHVREARCAAARAKGYRLASWVSRHAHVPASASIGENCVVMPGAMLQPFATLEEGVFLWHGAVVGHHARIGAQGWLASNCTISSTARLGARCFVGVNAAIGHELEIGADTLIGAGAVITRSTEPGGVYITPETPRFRLDSTRFRRIARI